MSEEITIIDGLLLKLRDLARNGKANYTKHMTDKEKLHLVCEIALRAAGNTREPDTRNVLIEAVEIAGLHEAIERHFGWKAPEC